MARSGPNNMIASLSIDHRQLAIDLAREGHPLGVIAKSIGRSGGKMHRALREIEEKYLDQPRGDLRDDDRIAVEWYLEFTAAQAEHAIKIKNQLSVAGPEWKRDAWVLEKVHPYAYGASSRHELSGPDGGPIETHATVAIYLPELDDAGDSLASEPGSANEIPGK